VASLRGDRRSEDSSDRGSARVSDTPDYRLVQSLRYARLKDSQSLRYARLSAYVSGDRLRVGSARVSDRGVIPYPWLSRGLSLAQIEAEICSDTKAQMEAQIGAQIRELYLSIAQHAGSASTL